MNDKTWFYTAVIYYRLCHHEELGSSAEAGRSISVRFLVACTRLYNPLRRSVRLSVCPSVRHFMTFTCCFYHLSKTPPFFLDSEQLEQKRSSLPLDQQGELFLQPYSNSSSYLDKKNMELSKRVKCFGTSLQKAVPLLVGWSVCLSVINSMPISNWPML